jgi:hypothetical protein
MEDWSRDEVKDADIPILVKAVPQFKDDIWALQRLMNSEKPSLKRARIKWTAKAYNGFGNASGSSFGATIQIGNNIHYEYGQWCSEVMEKKSSNWRGELNNLVEALKTACS